MIVFCYVYWVNVSRFNLLKIVTNGSFLFLWKSLVFLFLPLLNSGVQIRSPQNLYTDLTSALDQPLVYTPQNWWTHTQEQAAGKDNDCYLRVPFLGKLLIPYDFDVVFGNAALRV